ncbi:NAD(P)H-hydrate dehydratase [Candidatus Methylospira mobilis]|uniref:Bifunctional NAD(P)H-hydrate repair enzyme n=1 Tax=Candidatus Methylospira mobilis TaxID=1808979 RepID=A0A5Q0BIX3_9GAMM|nr:NAD(P)H-hydrate dehydratase [Candidatus Methylospira mobilis]QFY42151.1 NAD(P)H-hydrate dehydratase [Candidatus Methylospira mobilis]
MTLFDPSCIPSNLYRAAQVAAMDRHAIATLPVAGFELMTRAARAAYSVLRERWPALRTLSVVCGPGNNGGDGYLLALKAFEQGLDVRVYPAGYAAQLGGDALRAYRSYVDAGGAVLDFIPEGFEGAEVLVDALFGSGLNRDIEGHGADIVQAVNRFRGKVFALDIPSGLNADTGAIRGIAVKAGVTLTFVAAKQGLFTAEGPELCGDIYLDNLDLPLSIPASQPVSAELLPRRLKPFSGPRARNAHKGHFGHVLVVGGAPGFSGAARMAAEAAARVGAGLVSVATHPDHAAVLGIGRPELMCHAVACAAGLHDLLQAATVIVAGPGLGRSGWAEELFQAAIGSGQPLIIDADALNLLARTPSRSDRWVLTPHPGEAARLLATDTRTIQQDRFAAVDLLQRRYGGVVVLKGAGSLVQGEGGRPAVNANGNPGMSGGGMGDVLSGVIAGLLAQRLDPLEAARAGVCLHGHAGDCAAAESGERGLLASDLFAYLRAGVNG